MALPRVTLCSLQTVVTRPQPTGQNVDLTIGVSEGAHFVCNLNPEQTNYADLTGGGDLRMKYDYEGINLTGRYTLTSGEMKYSLPVIPLKTFTIKNGMHPPHRRYAARRDALKGALCSARCRS